LEVELFAYRRPQQAIVSKAIEYNVPVIFVNPRNTSSKCPRCGSKLEYVNRLAHCPACGFIADRDAVGAMNVWLKAHVGAPGSSPNALPMKDEAMTEGRKTREG